MQRAYPGGDFEDDGWTEFVGTKNWKAIILFSSRAGQATSMYSRVPGIEDSRHKGQKPSFFIFDRCLKCRSNWYCPLSILATTNDNSTRIISYQNVLLHTILKNQSSVRLLKLPTSSLPNSTEKANIFQKTCKKCNHEIHFNYKITFIWIKI